MANQSPTDPVNNVTTRTVNLSAEVKKMWGEKWAEPSDEYKFSNGRTFKRRTEDAAIYDTSPDF